MNLIVLPSLDCVGGDSVSLKRPFLNFQHGHLRSAQKKWGSLSKIWGVHAPVMIRCEIDFCSNPFSFLTVSI